MHSIQACEWNGEQVPGCISCSAKGEFVVVGMGNNLSILTLDFDSNNIKRLFNKEFDNTMYILSLYCHYDEFENALHIIVASNSVKSYVYDIANNILNGGKLLFSEITGEYNATSIHKVDHLCVGSSISNDIQLLPTPYEKSRSIARRLNVDIKEDSFPYMSAFHPNGDFLAIYYSGDKFVRMFSVDDRSELPMIPGRRLPNSLINENEKSAANMLFSNSGDILVFCGCEEVLIGWESEDYQLKSLGDSYLVGNVFSASFTDDERHLCCCDYHGRVVIYEINKAEKRLKQKIGVDYDVIVAFACHPIMPYIMVLEENGLFYCESISEVLNANMGQDAHSFIKSTNSKPQNSSVSPSYSNLEVSEVKADKQPKNNSKIIGSHEKSKFLLEEDDNENSDDEIPELADFATGMDDSDDEDINYNDGSIFHTNQEIDASYSAPTGDDKVNVMRNMQKHKPFSSSSFIDLDCNVLKWTNIGKLTCTEGEEKKIIQLAYTDQSKRPNIRFTSSDTYLCGTFDFEYLVLGGIEEETKKGFIFCEVMNPSNRVQKKWRLNIDGYPLLVALSSSFIWIYCSNHQLKVFGTGSREYPSIALDNVLSITNCSNDLFVLRQTGFGELFVDVFGFPRYRKEKTISVGINPKASPRFFSFCSNGLLCMLDSKYQLYVLYNDVFVLANQIEKHMFLCDVTNKECLCLKNSKQTNRPDSLSQTFISIPFELSFAYTDNLAKENMKLFLNECLHLTNDDDNTVLELAERFLNQDLKSLGFDFIQSLKTVDGIDEMNNLFQRFMMNYSFVDSLLEQRRLSLETESSNYFDYQRQNSSIASPNITNSPLLSPISSPGTRAFRKAISKRENSKMKRPPSPNISSPILSPITSTTESPKSEHINLLKLELEKQLEEKDDQEESVESKNSKVNDWFSQFQEIAANSPTTEKKFVQKEKQKKEKKLKKDKEETKKPVAKFQLL
eukprot:TRINITY_DN1161_c0_g1_i1.p1 TRINITY_DN1161_c0_g1~~TRINITY_DN1161_c0_g1_i1.p1  ORF type:complete len:971 (+),score=220.28 TRINITY_DN1161_c0_g1_i1:34-2913(+)